jgi:HmuY protein
MALSLVRAMRTTAGLLLAVLSVSGCHYYFGDDDGDGADDGGDDDVSDDGGGGVLDGGTPEPDAPGECDPIALLPALYQPVEAVSSGAVTTEPDPQQEEVFTTTVDASAGGSSGQAEQPFVYLDLDAAEGAAKVEIDDVAALESEEWDIALKRFVIRSNSGDSGIADVEVATVQAEELTFNDDVPSDRFADDDWSSADCALETDATGGPRTRFSNWYRVQAGRFEPQPVVHLVRLSGRYAEIDVLTYYGDEADPKKSGVYVLRWRRFP